MPFPEALSKASGAFRTDVSILVVKPLDISPEDAGRLGAALAEMASHTQTQGTATGSLMVEEMGWGARQPLSLQVVYTVCQMQDPVA